MGRIDRGSADYEPMPIVGYCDTVSAEPGQTVRFFVSCDGASQYNVEMVRLINGDLTGRESALVERHVATPVNGSYPGFRQATHPGSCIVVDKHVPDLSGQLSVQAMICPTLPRSGHEQAIVAQWSADKSRGWALYIDESGKLAFRAGTAEPLCVSLERQLLTGLWYLVGVVADARTGQVELFQEHIPGFYNSRTSLRSPDEPFDDSLVHREIFNLADENPAKLMVAGWEMAVLASGRVLTAAHFNGKIDRPRIASRCLSRDEMRTAVDCPLDINGLVAAWDFSSNITSQGVATFDTAFDLGPYGLSGRLVNMPKRGVTGYNWDGAEYCFRHAPAQYGAIHFHDDDLIDCAWEPGFDFTVPEGLQSGIYAAKVSALIGGVMEEDYITYFVRPGRGSKLSAIAYIAGTASYLAYANDMFSSDYADIEALAATMTHLGESALARNQHREYGASLYDLHSDGSGICYSSWLRPILTMRPKVSHHSALRTWQFNADLQMVAWFEKLGFAVDVLTDHDVQADGVNLLSSYKLAVTGTHPEYYSAQMLDCLHNFVENDGGRLMYMGGNGFYWVTAFLKDDPRIIEIQRWGGTQAWAAPPGEYYLGFTGEMGGLWRARGRAPQKLTGVGFIAQGQDRASWFRANPDSVHPEASWIFEGVGSREKIGDHGPHQEGAAGLELDWYDPALGSPGWAKVVASSEGHSRFMLEARENLGCSMPFMGGDMNAKVRADMVYFKTTKSGAVFSTGSISWCGALSHNGCDNDVSRITENVVRRFSADGPLP